MNSYTATNPLLSYDIKKYLDAPGKPTKNYIKEKSINDTILQYKRKIHDNEYIKNRWIHKRPIIHNNTKGIIQNSSENVYTSILRQPTVLLNKKIHNTNKNLKSNTRRTLLTDSSFGTLYDTKKLIKNTNNTSLKNIFFCTIEQIFHNTNLIIVGVGNSIDVAYTIESIEKLKKIAVTNALQNAFSQLILFRFPLQQKGTLYKSISTLISGKIFKKQVLKSEDDDTIDEIQYKDIQTIPFCHPPIDVYK